MTTPSSVVPVRQNPFGNKLKPQSAKAKGRKLQQETRDAVRAAFPQLEEGDVRSNPMGAPGPDLLLSPAALRLFPFDVECKNQEGINIWSALAQCLRDSGRTPLLVFRRNNTKPYAALPFDDFMALVQLANLGQAKEESATAPTTAE